MSEFTLIRAKRSDNERIRVIVETLGRQPGAGNYATHHVVSLALDAFEENILNKKGISTVGAGEIPKTINQPL